MVVTLTTPETDTEIILRWVSTEAGDVVENRSGVRSEHETKVVIGRVRLEVKDRPPEDFEAPHTITLPTGTPYTFTTLTPATVHCFYNKLSGAADDIRHLLTDEPRTWDQPI